MTEWWLRPNRRALLLFGPAPLALLAAAALCAWWGVAAGSAVVGVCAVVLGVVAALLLLVWWAALATPRLAYRAGRLRVHLRLGAPLEVPIDLVECFFLGQDESPVRGPDGRPTETATIVVRLAERASEWRSRSVNRLLGRWCDGYIVINGAWCEPIDRPLMEQLNGRLAAAHREQKRRREEAA